MHSKTSWRHKNNGSCIGNRRFSFGKRYKWYCVLYAICYKQNEFSTWYIYKSFCIRYNNTDLHSDWNFGHCLPITTPSRSLDIWFDSDSFEHHAICCLRYRVTWLIRGFKCLGYFSIDCYQRNNDICIDISTMDHHICINYNPYIRPHLWLHLPT